MTDSVAADKGGIAISALFLVSKIQMARISPILPLSNRMPNADNRRVISGIIFVIRNGCSGGMFPQTTGHKRQSIGGKRTNAEIGLQIITLDMTL